MAADHFQPWVPAQGNAPFVWNVLTAIGERTTGDIGPGVTCPSFRFHPAMVAQASATLAAMYPGRHWLGLGSGEALNEHIVGGYWPEAPERLDAHVGGHRDHPEAVHRQGRQAPRPVLPAGDDAAVDHAGRAAADLHRDRRPDHRASAPASRWTASSRPARRSRRSRTCSARFDAGAKEAGREAGSQVKILQLHLSWAPTDEEALANAMTEWPNGGMKFPKQRHPVAARLRADGQARAAGGLRGPHAHLVRPGRAPRARSRRFLDTGVDRVYLHNVGRNQTEWIDVFGRDVLPKLTS